MLTAAVLAGTGAALGAFESMLPVMTSIPGGKLGIANIATVTALYLLGTPSAFAVSGVRVAVASMIYGGANAFIYGFAGAMASLAAMAASKHFLKERISPVGISVIGASFHNAAQTAVAMCVLRSVALIWYLACLLLISVVSGTVCGYLAQVCIERMKIGKGSGI